MLFWGLFALVFCTVVPGLAVVACAPIALTAIQTVPIVVGLSLILNHLAVGGLFLAGLYRPSIVVPLAVAVSLLTGCLVAYRLRRNGPAEASSRATEEPTPYELLGIGLLVLAAGFHVLRATNDFGNVFSLWDAIVSWNRWAIDWSLQIFPRGSYDYPQLLPTLWSLTYQLIGTTDVQVFAKAVVAWLPLAGVLAFAGIWQQERTSAGVVGAIVFTLLLRQFKELAISGYVEFPTATMALIAYFAGWLATRSSGNTARWLAIAGGVIAAGAAACKQGGLYYAFFYPLFFYLLSPDRRQARTTAALAFAVIVAIVGFAYSLRFIAGPPRAPGQSGSIAWALMFGKIHGDSSAWQKMARSLTLLTTQWLTPKLLVPLGILWFFALRTALGRILLLGTVVPPLTIYTLFFGYDIRNALFCAPFLGWAAGVGFHELAVGWLRPMTDRLFAERRLTPRWIWQFGRVGSGLAGTVLLCAALATLVVVTAAFRARGLPSDRYFADNEKRMLAGIGYKHLNEDLLPWIEREKIKGKILTNYTILNYIPGARELYLEPNDPSRFAGLDNDLERLKPEFVLDIMAAFGETAPDISRLLAAGKLTLIREFPRRERLYRVTAHPTTP